MKLLPGAGSGSTEHVMEKEDKQYRKRKTYERKKRVRRTKYSNSILSEPITAHSIPYTTAYVSVTSILLGFFDP
jgi:hypothetical protein